MDEEKIHPGGDRFLKRSEPGIDGCADFGHSSLVGHLEAVERPGGVLECGAARAFVAIGHQFGKARHASQLAENPARFEMDFFSGSATVEAMSDTPSPVDLIAQAAAAFPHRPSWDEYFMATAVLIASRSNCERLHVGCVIVTAGERRNRIVAAGYNGYLPGAAHTSRLRDGHEQSTVHAEQNAIADAARRGSSVSGCVAYVTHYPCINCAKILSAAGLSEIKYRLDYNNDPLVAPLLADAGVKVLQLT